MGEKSQEVIWYEDIGAFLTLQNYFIILPMDGMTLEQKLNAIVRFFSYLGVMLMLLRADTRYLFLGIVAAIVSIAIYEHEKKDRAKAERFLEEKQLDIVDAKVCVRSTVDNPFMNPTLADITDNPDRPAACSTSHPKVQEAVEKNFEARLFKDVSDLYGRMSSQREFYTVPVTTIPNDAGGFAQWLYGAGATCKEGNGLQCQNNQYRYIHN